MSRRLTIGETFESLRARKQTALMPFVSSGYPSLEATSAILPALEEAGASIIEVGIPFSDPIADGPVIQEAFIKALAKGLKLREVFAAVERVRNAMTIPLVAMVSYSVVYRYGLERFCGDAKAAGFDGLILPDLPPPEAEAVTKKVQAAGLDTILLVAPTSTGERRKQIAALSSGFVYYLSVSGVTGERNRLPEDLEGNIAEIKRVSERPVCVGFGISTAEHVKQVGEVADGAIVGSAFARRIREHETEAPAAIARALGEYCRELLRLVR